MNTPNFGVLILQSNSIESLEKNSLYFFRRDYSHLDIKCNELNYIDRNVLDGMTWKSFTIDLYSNKLVSLPEGIFDNHSFIKIDVGENPLRNVSQNFCCRKFSFRL